MDHEIRKMQRNGNARRNLINQIRLGIEPIPAVELWAGTTWEDTKEACTVQFWLANETQVQRKAAKLTVVRTCSRMKKRHYYMDNETLVDWMLHPYSLMDSSKTRNAIATVLSTYSVEEQDIQTQLERDAIEAKELLEMNYNDDNQPWPFVSLDETNEPWEDSPYRELDTQKIQMRMEWSGKISYIDPDFDDWRDSFGNCISCNGDGCIECGED